MSSENIVLSSVKESFLIIKKNKKTFLLVFSLQILFLSLIIAASAYYMPRILQSTQQTIDYAESLNINSDTANIDMLRQKSPFGDDPLLITRNYDLIMKNSIILLSLIFLIFVVVNGMAWYFASNILEKGRRLFSLKNIFSYLSRFFIISVVLSLFLYLMAYNMANIAFSSYLSVKPVDFVPLFLVAIIAVYLIYISMPILGKIKFRSLAKSSFSIGTKSFIPVIISYLIILSLVILSLFLVFYFIELNLFLLLASVLLFLLVFSWAKIYFSIVIRRLSGL